MPIHVIRHVPFEHLGLIAPVLERYGLTVQWLDMGQSIGGLLNTAEAIIAMGGPMSVNDPDPWVAVEVDLIQRAIDAGVPVLGVCLGAQLIAKAMGAQVRRNPVKEIGWYPTFWTPAAREDKLLGGLPQPAYIFQWHGETFEIPNGCEWLARTETCPHQAFRYADRVYAFQFHAEVTPEMIENWLRQDANCADTRELDHPVDPCLHAQEQASLAETLFSRWVERVVLR